MGLYAVLPCSVDKIYTKIYLVLIYEYHETYHTGEMYTKHIFHEVVYVAAYGNHRPGTSW